MVVINNKGNGIMTRWLIKVWGGVDSNIDGPYESDEERSKEAYAYMDDGEENQPFALDIDSSGKPHIYDYAPKLYMENEDDPPYREN